MLTVAYYGNGKSTNRYHVPFSYNMKDVIKVKTIYSRRPESEWATWPGVTYTQDINDIYNDSEIQLVVVTTPSSTHYEIAKDILNHGKNVLVEKPFTETLDQAKELFDLAHEKGLFCQCYQNRRFDSDFLTVQQVIESGKLGEIYEVEMHYDYYRAEVPLNTPAFSKIDSFLYGHACHTLDQVISYWGQPDSVNYEVKQLLGAGRMNDYFDLDLHYKRLKISVKSSYFRLKERPSFVVYGTKGQFVKASKDRQEVDLKAFVLPDTEGFGLDRPQDYGVLTYLDSTGQVVEERVETVRGDYRRFYQALHDSIVLGHDKLVKDHETLLQIGMLEKGIQQIEE